MNRRWIRTKYGKRFKDDLLVQYQIMVDTSEQLTNKRHKTNQFYIAVHTLLMGITGWLTTTDSSTVIIAVLGFVLSAVWFENIRSYKKLNGAKFKIIHELEEHLPADMFKQEEEYLKSNKYFMLTTVERWVPVIFAFLYLLGGIIILF